MSTLLFVCQIFCKFLIIKNFTLCITIEASSKCAATAESVVKAVAGPGYVRIALMGSPFLRPFTERSSAHS